MKKFLKYVALIAAVLVVSSSAWAWSPFNHVTQAPNNEGDVLIFPYFIASPTGWSTELTVINTDLRNSVVAKLVIRSAKNSQELKDFLLYLSPSDVWTGKIYYDKGVIKIFSSDDSIATKESGNVPVFATAAAPVDEPLEAVKCTVDDVNSFGYVHVTMAAYGTVTSATSFPIAGPGTPKTLIYGKYFQDTEGNQDEIQTGPTGLNFPTLYTGINPLAGYMKVVDDVSNLSAEYRATALKNYKNLYKLTPGNDTQLGQGSANSIAEIEAALSKDELVMPTVDPKLGTVHIFTFPTKETNISKGCDKATTTSRFFKGSLVVPFKPRDFNLVEGSKTPQFSPGKAEFSCEVNYLTPTFAEGWSYYIFDRVSYGYMNNTDPDCRWDREWNRDDDDEINYKRGNLKYYGAPVLATFLLLTDNGMTGTYGAWKDTPVYYRTFCEVKIVDDADRWTKYEYQLCDYQYTQFAVCSIADYVYQENGGGPGPNPDDGAFPGCCDL